MIHGNRRRYSNHIIYVFVLIERRGEDSLGLLFSSLLADLGFSFSKKKREKS